MSEPSADPRAELERWVEGLAAEFGLDAAQLPIDPILRLTADVAHQVVRPAAPFTVYVVGLVAGLAGGSPEKIAEVLKRAAGMLPEQS